MANLTGLGEHGRFAAFIGHDASGANLVARRHAGHRRYGSRPVGREDGDVTDLLARPLLRRDEPAWGSRVPWLAGVLAAAWALVAGIAPGRLPPTLGGGGEGGQGTTGGTLRF